MADKNKNTNRNKRSGNPRDLSRSTSRSSSSRGASSHPNGQGSGHPSGRGDRGPSHRGEITPNLYRPRVPSQLSQGFSSQDVEALLSQSTPAIGNDFRNNHGTVNFNLNFIGTPSDAANLQRLAPLGSLEAVTAPQQSRPNRSTPQPRPDPEPRRGRPDTRSSSATLSSRTQHSVASSRRAGAPERSVGSVTTLQRSKSLIAGWRNYRKHGKCGNCDVQGHSVMDCLVAHEDGFIRACPICNMGNHTIDTCRHLPSIDLFEELVLNRGNKPPICTSTDWFQLWVSKRRPQVPLPHSTLFARAVAHEEGGAMVALGQQHNPKTYKYQHPCDPQREVPLLPPDIFTSGSMQRATAAKLTLGPQIAADPRTARTPALRAPEGPQGEPEALDVDAVNAASLPRPAKYVMLDAPRLEDTPHVFSSAGQTSGDPSAHPGFPSFGAWGSHPGLANSTHAPPTVPMLPAADPLTNLGADKCPNCSGSGEGTCVLDLGGCSMPCRACGNPKHTIAYCLIRNAICRCEPIPRHIRSQCPIACRRCWVDKGCPTGTDLDVGKVPRVIDCRLHCGICDMNRDDPAHVHYVPYTGCQRPNCDNTHDESLGQNETHYRQDCVDRLCAHHSCRHNGEILTTGTCQHCPKCGSETINANGLNTHKCQWKPDWGMLDLAGNRVLAARLRCVRNPNHATTTSTDLLVIRATGFQRLWKDYNAWVKNGSKGDDPRVTRPIVECQECFETIWDDGIYAEQKPGAKP